MVGKWWNSLWQWSIITITQSIDYEPDYTYELISATFPDDPTRTNYIFAGWYDNENKEGEPYTTYTGTQNITLHANWTGEPIQVCIGDDCHEVPYGTETNLGVNDTAKVNTIVSTVTFKYHDDVTDDTTSNVIKTYTPNGWLVNGEVVADNTTITVTESTTIEKNYIETKIPAEFPSDPTKENYGFNGWFDTAVEGNKYTSYDGDDNITLHAQYTGNAVQVCVDEDCEDIPYGTEKNLGVNNDPKETDNIATVTFNPHNDEDLIVRYVTRSYVPNGWFIGGTHYDDNATITIEEPIQIDRDYIGTVNGVEFPEDPELENHTFEGWFDAEEDGTQYTSYANEENITLHAQWSINGPTDITLETVNLLLVVGQERQINVSTVPENTPTQYQYSGYSDIINIDNTGLITAISAGTTTVTVSVANNPDISKEMTVTVINNLITSQVYDVTSKDKTGEDVRIIIGAEPETTIEDFLTNVDNPTEYIEVYDVDDNLVTDYEEYVTTGTKLKLVIDNVTHDEVIVIIRGDIDCDGYVDVADNLMLRNHILYVSLLEDYRIYAADLDEDPEAELEDMLDAADKAKLNKYILNEISSLNEKDGE